MEPTERRLRLGDVTLCLFEWGAPRPDRATYLLAHATGFHARCWDAVIRRLGACHVVAVDLRGHGRSDTPVIRHWKVFGEDLVGIVDELDLGQVTGVGHSMGGHAMTQAAARRPDRFARLLLVDPVIVAPDDRPPLDDEEHPTARRKNRFRSPEEMIDRFRERPPYAAFHPEVLQDYGTHGLRPAPDGDGFVLACPPATEASIYRTSRTNPDILVATRAVACPVEIVRAKEPPPDRSLMDFSSSPTWPQLVSQFPRRQFEDNAEGAPTLEDAGLTAKQEALFVDLL